MFCKVVEGYAIVKKMEKQGSQRGDVKSKVIIKDCGEIENVKDPQSE